MSLFKITYSKLGRVWNDFISDTKASKWSINNTNRNVILVYHGIDTLGTNPFNTRHTSLSYFEKQLTFLKRNYRIVSLKEYFEFHNTTTNLCAITFDDGYLNNFINAVPLLEKYNCPATFFVTGLNEINLNILWADYVNIAGKLIEGSIKIDEEVFTPIGGVLFSKDRKKSILEIAKHIAPEFDYKVKIYKALNEHLDFISKGLYSEYWRLMNDSQISSLSNNRLFDIGSHGYYHNNLGNVLKENAFDEIKKSKKYLENLTQKAVHCLGYPDGSYSKQTIAFAKQLGFLYQTCNDGFINSEDVYEKHLLNRNGIYNCDSAANQLITALNA